MFSHPTVWFNILLYFQTKPFYNFVHSVTLGGTVLKTTEGNETSEKDMSATSIVTKYE